MVAGSRIKVVKADDPFSYTPGPTGSGDRGGEEVRKARDHCKVPRLRDEGPFLELMDD